MKHAILVVAAGFSLLGAPAHAAVTFEYLFDDGFPLAVSTDGSVVAGNGATGGYIPFRWTEATGFVSLGRPQFVGMGGVPGMSADGTRVASSIGSLDSSYTTAGLWTLGSGWQELLPPLPPDGGIMDGSYANVWGLSGDGSTVVGLYWRPGGRAHALKWTEATGAVDLGGTTHHQASRANGVNHDGSVIVGWVETPFGPWRPAVWENGSLVLLTYFNPSGASMNGTGEARATNPSGDIVVGYARDSISDQRAAAMWKRTNGVWGPTRILGWVDGSEPGGYGINSAHSVSADGRIVIGYCSFDGSPFVPTGFVWTEETGVIDVNVFLANNGVLPDPNFAIQGMSVMTPDGTKLYGYGQMLIPPYTRRAFRINVPNTVDARVTDVAGLHLSAPAPNPSRGDTRLEFTLPSAAAADLSIFDAAGRRVATLWHGDLPAGRRSVTWDGREPDGRTVAAGLYFARLTTPAGSVHRRIVRVR